VLKAALTPVVHLLVRPRAEGLEHVPTTGAAILCANHVSFIDPVVVAVLVPRPVFYLGKSEYFGRRWRWFFARLGVVPVARRGGAAGESSLERGREVLRSAALLGIYPEGTRSPDGRLYRGKTGAARLAMRTGAPVVPIGVTGTREAMPPGALLPRRGRVVVRFGPPLDFSHLHGRDNDRIVLREATDALMTEIGALSGQIYADVYAAQARAAQASGQPLHQLDHLQPDDVSCPAKPVRRMFRGDRDPPRFLSGAAGPPRVSWDRDPRRFPHARRTTVGLSRGYAADGSRRAGPRPAWGCV
jgi:1-acyl-sn-glycerol-3-phosphate acyltransferase